MRAVMSQGQGRSFPLVRSRTEALRPHRFQGVSCAWLCDMGRISPSACASLLCSCIFPVQTLELTEKGTVLARFGRELIERRQSIVSELNGQKDSQPVVLAAGEGAFLYLLGQAISNYKSKSNQPLRLLTLNRDSVVEAIQSGRAHFGVAAFDTIPAGCQSRPLHKADQLLVMPKDYKLASKKKTLSLADLQGLSLVVPAIDRPHRQLIATHLQSRGVEWQVAVEANGWELMLHFVKLGLGCAIVNSICNIPPGLTAKTIVDLPQIHYSIIWRRGAKLSTAQALLRDCLSP